jgi:DNA topoisomerase-1
LDEDLSERSLSRRKVLAAAVSIMADTGIRVGNNEYEKLYGSFGLTTLKDKHAHITRSSVRFQFKGKKGIYQYVSLSSKKLARIVRQCRDLPGKELFQYVDEKGERCTITSGDVNAYIKEISGGHFTAKDFRTWAGSLHCLKNFQEIKLGEAASEAEIKRRVNAALDAVSTHLGNTRTVCRKYYVHPAIIEYFEGGKLSPFFEKAGDGTLFEGLEPDEIVLMRLLEAQKCGVTL